MQFLTTLHKLLTTDLWRQQLCFQIRGHGSDVAVTGTMSIRAVPALPCQEVPLIESQKMRWKTYRSCVPESICLTRSMNQNSYSLELKNAKNLPLFFFVLSPIGKGWEMRTGREYLEEDKRIFTLLQDLGYPEALLRKQPFLVDNELPVSPGHPVLLT